MRQKILKYLRSCVSCTVLPQHMNVRRMFINGDPESFNPYTYAERLYSKIVAAEVQICFSTANSSSVLVMCYIAQVSIPGLGDYAVVTKSSFRDPIIPEVVHCDE